MSLLSSRGHEDVLQSVEVRRETDFNARALTFDGEDLRAPLIAQNHALFRRRKKTSISLACCSTRVFLKNIFSPLPPDTLDLGTLASHTHPPVLMRLRGLNLVALLPIYCWVGHSTSGENRLFETRFWRFCSV